jgi:CRISPR-associated endonuclease Cas2
MAKSIKTKVMNFSKEVLKYLLLAGAVYIAASSPSFAFQLTKNIWKPKRLPYSKRKITDAFIYLKKRKLIEVKREDHDVCIALTEEGRKRAGKYQIDDLEIKTPKKWDGKWRVVIFDIPDGQRVQRDAFRRKLKEFGFFSLQKSVWVHLFDCKEEIELLREFFGLDKKQIQVLLVDKIESDLPLRKIYKL